MEITMTTQLHPNREEILQETMSRIRSELVRQGRLARLEDYYDETPTDQLPKPPPLGFQQLQARRCTPAHQAVFQIQSRL